MSDLFPGFRVERIVVSHSYGSEIGIHCRVGGEGPPLLLLHGYPQTGAMWHKIAGDLSRLFTVVCPDLRGYGASDKSPTDSYHLPYSKRAMAADQVAVMAALGFSEFQVAGHDRGARVTHRICLDFPEAVQRAAVLDIIPTRTFFRTADHAASHSYYHWYFLAQAAPLPETLIGADPIFYFRSKAGGLSGTGVGVDCFDPAARGEYEAAFTPEVVHASCEDYCAGATVDLEHDEADLDRKIACPLLVLWGSKAPMQAHFDVLETW